MSIENEFIGMFIEIARQRLLQKHGNLINRFSKEGNVRALDSWLEGENEKPIEEAVRYAAAKIDLDSDEMMDMAHSSLKFRCLAGTLTLPIEYQQLEPECKGECGRLEFKEDKGCWQCKLPDSQSQREADQWHAKWGTSPACPHWQNPNPKDDQEIKTELDKFTDEGKHLFEWERDHKLKNYQKKGI